MRRTLWSDTVQSFGDNRLERTVMMLLIGGCLEDGKDFPLIDLTHLLEPCQLNWVLRGR